MGVKGVSFLVLLVSICVFASAETQTAAEDCSTLVLNMVDCLSFVSNGSTDSKPAKTCCNGLKTVLKANSSCLCEGFKNSAQFGVVLNVTKAMALPAECKVSAPSVSDCGLSVTPAAAPALSPAPASSSPKGHAPSIAAPSIAPAVATTAPAPAPSSSGSSSMAGSVGFLAICLGVVSFFSF